MFRIPTASWISTRLDYKKSWTTWFFILKNSKLFFSFAAYFYFSPRHSQLTFGRIAGSRAPARRVIQLSRYQAFRLDWQSLHLHFQHLVFFQVRQFYTLLFFNLNFYFLILPIISAQICIMVMGNSFSLRQYSFLYIFCIHDTILSIIYIFTAILLLCTFPSKQRADKNFHNKSHETMRIGAEIQILSRCERESFASGRRPFIHDCEEKIWY